MRKVIAAINMILDGFCNYTAGIPDEEIHQYYAYLLSNSDTILYGRITYQLMEFWRTVVKNPSGEKSMDGFAIAIDKISKLVFSHTLKSVEWESAKLVKRTIDQEVLALKQQAGRDILVGSRSLIIQLIKLNLVDELQLCIYPVVARRGLPLFENIHDRTILKLIKTKTFSGKAVILYYELNDEKTPSR